MAYAEKYILSFISERGNDYKISILQQGYSGSAVSKKLGVAPSLSIEEGDGRIKGSSLSFSIQADVEGELSGLYTTNNKEFKVILYRNDSVYWQGYLLPELYSENYVDPPFDVAVTATDQLATLKDIPYQAQEQQISLLSIIKNILNYTEITLPCTVHMQIEDSQGLSLLENHHISAAAMNGYSCYDALNALLLSCNACIMQIGNEWLITSLTDNTSAYYKEGQLTNRPHPTIGQMHKADIYPDGSLTMVNAPAIKGATLEYNHILRNSMLRNAECKSREYWNYLPGEVDARFPSEFQAIDGVVYKCFSWSLQEKNIANDSSLQLWQDVQLNTDESFNYQLSVKYLPDVHSKLLLLSIAHYGDDGIVRRLTAEGWKKSVDKNDINSYIQITSSQTDYTIMYVWDIADTSKYEVANVQFALPEVSGSLRVGFINSTTDYAEPVTLGGMFVTDIFLTPLNIAGKGATTVVEQSATTSQQEVVISYGDKTQSNNDSLISFNTLRSAQGGYVNVWNLSGREYSSYFLMMLQDFSRYFGSKRMQLQGAIMGKDILHPFYVDSFSGKILRLLSAQYDLLQDTMSTNIEEVPVAFVEYDTTVYAKENVQNNQSTSGSVVATGGGESYLSLQSDGDVYVKGDRPLTGKEGRFEQLTIPTKIPTNPKEGEVYGYVSDKSNPVVDLSPLLKRINVGTDEEPQWAVIPVDYEGKPVGIVSDTFITAGGKKSDDPNGTATTLGGLNNVDAAADDLQSEAVVLTKGVNATHWTLRALSTLGLNKTELENYLTTNSYLKKDTADSLYASLTSFNALNTKVNDFLEGSDTDTIINKWKELEAFLAGQTESSTLAELLAIKANQSALDAHIANYNNFVNNTYATHIAAYNTHIADYNSFKNTTNDRLVALESLWAIDEENNALYPRNSRGIWSYDFITAGGKANSGSSSGGLIQAVYDYNNLGGNFNNNNLTDTFNAYAINSIYNEVQRLKESAGSAFNETALWQSLAKADATKVIDSSHIPDLSSKYLPLSGGTISNSNYGALVVKRSGSTLGYSAISFANDAGILGYIGIGGSGSDFPLQPTFYDGTNSYGIIHSGNYSSYALPLSGGTVGNSSWAKQLTLHRPIVNGAVVLGFSNGPDGHLGYLGIGGSGSGNIAKVPFYEDANGNDYLLIHSGNIGSQSVNYANSAGLADYSIWTRGFDYTNTQLDLNNLSRPMWWWYGQGNVGLANIPYDYGYGGGITFRQQSLTSLNGQFAWDINHNTSTPTKNLWFRASNNLGWGNDWKTIAFTDSNVASATKLATARTIWGQSFNGTRDVDGNIYSTLTDFQLYYNTNKLFLQAAATGIFLGEGTADTTYLSLHGKYIRLRIGSSEKMRIANSGNVLIGTTTDNGTKLQVAGSIYTKGIMMPNYTAIQSYLTDGTVVNLMFMDTANLLRIGSNSYNANIDVKRLGIGNPDPQYKLDVNGTLNAGDTTLSSLGVTDNATIGGTLGVEGMSTLGELSAGATNVSSLTSSGNITSTSGYIKGNHGLIKAAYIGAMASDRTTAPNDYAATIESLAVRYWHTLDGWVWSGVHCGTLEAAENVFAEGEITAGRVGSSSDRKLKNNIEHLTADKAISIIKKLNPSLWTWNNLSHAENKKGYGLIAQDVQPILPDAVIQGKNHLSLDYNQFHAFEISVLQNHETRLESVERENREMRCEIERLNKELNQYRRA